jgi:DNA adenine methylase
MRFSASGRWPIQVGHRQENRLSFLPRAITPKAPPIKTQGIKTKVVPLIARSIVWNGSGRWIEPFLGSAVVVLNIAPRRALLADTNEHVIALYRGIQDGAINGCTMRNHLEREGTRLLDEGETRYYAVRDRFNEHGNPFDFVFLSRSCFNGMMRFNRKGGFNVPFCRKPERFRPALVTKIVNQVEWARRAMSGKDWDFVVQDWRTTIADAKPGDMVYCDPPYVGRHTDYYNGFTDEESDDLARALIETRASFALSNWLENNYRRNAYVDRWFSGHEQRTMSHFYHVGSQEALRNEMTEVVILSACAAAAPVDDAQKETALPRLEAAELADA